MWCIFDLFFYITLLLPWFYVSYNWHVDKVSPESRLISLRLYEKRGEHRREINSGATQSDTEWQWIRPANRKIRVLIVTPWCWYATRRERSDSEEAVTQQKDKSR